MPDWYGDHKFMMFPPQPFHSLFARLPVLPVMTFTLRLTMILARGTVTLLLAMLVASSL